VHFSSIDEQDSEERGPSHTDERVLGDRAWSFPVRAFINRVPRKSDALLPNKLYFVAEGDTYVPGQEHEGGHYV
jgi:hypothetical protein